MTRAPKIPDDAKRRQLAKIEKPRCNRWKPEQRGDPRMSPNGRVAGVAALAARSAAPGSKP